MELRLWTKAGSQGSCCIFGRSVYARLCSGVGSLIWAWQRDFDLNGIEYA